jgi:nitroimidazol reductase NimA-like FMN-containing flavoprotein (pyridoxamine 5'-phosphate oxidase superfamily)
MRRKDRLLPNDEALSIIMEGEYGILSTVSSINVPYGVPLNYCFVNLNIYFHCALKGQKLENIENNAKVSFCVVGETQIEPEIFSSKYESCIVQGTAEEVFEEEKQLALAELIKKYSPAFQTEGTDYVQKVQGQTRVIKIVPDSFSGKAKR